MIFRLWSSTHSDGTPSRNATCDWWQLCDCGRLDRLPIAITGPRGLVADSDDGIPAEVEEVAARLQHFCMDREQPSKRRRWTADDDRCVLEQTVDEAAATLGRTRQAIIDRRKRLVADGRMRTQHGGIRRGANA